MDEGANVLGYIYWSLTDNYEWAYNYKPGTQFGLYFINRTGRDFLGDVKVHFSDIPLAGGKGDDILNAGVMLSSSNCVIDDVILELLNKDGSIIATTNKGQPDAVSPPLLHLIPIGARIVASNEGTRNEQVKVHWFFDGGATIRYRLHYYLRGQDCNNDGQPDFNRKVTIGAQALQGIITASVGAAVTDPSLTTASSKFGTFTPDGGGIIPPYTGKLLVHVQPYPISFKPGSRIVTVNLTVYSEDSQSHTPISGRVIIDGKDVSST